MAGWLSVRVLYAPRCNHGLGAFLHGTAKDLLALGILFELYLQYHFLGLGG